MPSQNFTGLATLKPKNLIFQANNNRVCALSVGGNLFSRNNPFYTTFLTFPVDQLSPEDARRLPPSLTAKLLSSNRAKRVQTAIEICYHQRDADALLDAILKICNRMYPQQKKLSGTLEVAFSHLHSLLQDGLYTKDTVKKLIALSSAPSWYDSLKKTETIQALYLIALADCGNSEVTKSIRDQLAWIVQNTHEDLAVRALAQERLEMLTTHLLAKEAFEILRDKRRMTNRLGEIARELTAIAQDGRSKDNRSMADGCLQKINELVELSKHSPAVLISLTLDCLKQVGASVAYAKQQIPVPPFLQEASAPQNP